MGIGEIKCGKWEDCDLLSMEPWAAVKIFKIVLRCHRLLCGFLANGHLPRISRQSRLSVNNEGDNEMIPRTVHRSSGIYLRKSAAKRPSMEAGRPVIASNGTAYFQIRSVGSHRALGSVKKERRKGRG
jgi:hypothetical protein